MLKKGLFFIAPVAITLAVLVWLFNFLENTFKIPVIWIIGKNYYYPGMGLVFAIAVLFFLGMIVNTFIARKLTEWGESLIKKIPLIKTIYTSVQDFMEYFNSSKKKQGSRIVKVTIQNMELLGIVTKDDFSDFPELNADKKIAVYLPMSYQIGGYTVFCTQDQITPVEMKVDDALQFILTAGAKQKKQEKSL